MGNFFSNLGQKRKTLNFHTKKGKSISDLQKRDGDSPTKEDHNSIQINQGNKEERSE